MKPWVVAGMLSIQLIIPGFSGGRPAWAWPAPAQLVQAVSPRVAPAMPSTPSAVPATGIPDEVQLAGTHADPTLRFPVCHSTWNGGTLVFHFKASYGWLEVRRSNVRYVKVRQSARTKKQDVGLDSPPAQRCPV